MAARSSRFTPLVVRLRAHRSAYWIGVGVCAVGAAALIFFENNSFYRDFLDYARTPPPLKIREFHSARLTIDFSDGRKRAFEGAAPDGTTILTALRLASTAGRFSIGVSSRGEIMAIAGVRNTANRRWRVSLNRATVSDLPGTVEVRGGDRIVLTYE